MHAVVHARGNQSVIVFLTICTCDRKAILAQPQAVPVLRQAWAKARLWVVGHWMLMPDHLHLFCSPATIPPEPLVRWVGYWKGEVARSWPCRADQPIWQRDFWDTQLRSNDSTNLKWHYVRLNPVRKGLVDSESAWPYQGEENVLRWHNE